MPLGWYHSALIIMAVGCFATNLPLYLYDTSTINSGVAPKHWMIAYWLFASPLMVNQLSMRESYKSPLLIWCFGYAWISLTWFYYSSQSDISWQELRYRMFTCMILVSFLTVLVNPLAVRLARQTLVATVLIGVALNSYELFIPMSFSPIPGRSAGLYLNPNMSAEALVIGMVLAIDTLEPKYRVPFLLLAGIGITLTFSRSGMVAWGMAVTGLMITDHVRSKDIVVSCGSALLLVVALLLPRWDQLLTTLERAGSVNQNVLERLDWFSDPMGASDFSSWERTYVARMAWERIADYPVLGSGTGSSSEAVVPSHNQYLSLMIDHGVLGGLIVPIFVVAVTWGARGRSREVALIFAAIILWLSFFSHRMLDREYLLIPCAVMAALTVTSRFRSEDERATMIQGKPGVVVKAWART